jgi:hypothetical protein
MADKTKAPRKRATPAAGGGRRTAGGKAGRLTVRRDTAPYRAAAQETASQVRESIEAAVAAGRRTREEIEARIEKQWHNRAPAAKKAAPRRRKAAKATRH